VSIQFAYRLLQRISLHSVDVTGWGFGSGGDGGVDSWGESGRDLVGIGQSIPFMTR
jgi:hypothetical protein